MNKAFKKGITLLLSAALVLSSLMIANAAVEPPTGSGTLLAFQDFEGSKSPNDASQDIYLTGGSSITEENGNKMAVGKSYSGNDVMGEAGRVMLAKGIFDGNPDKVLLSLDMKLLFPEPIRFYIQNQSGNMVGYFIYTKNGKIAFMKSASLPGIDLSPSGDTSAYSVTDYEIDVWTSIDMIFDTKKGTISYYADSVHMCDVDMPSGTGSYPKMFLGQMNPTSTSENYLCVDNVSVTVPSENSFYATASLGDGEIKINLSETPVMTDLSGIEVRNTENGKVLSTSSASLEGKQITIPYTGELASSTEYRVLLPSDLKSVAGNTLYSNDIYFISSVKGGADKLDFVDDFEAYENVDEKKVFTEPDGWYAYKHSAGVSRLQKYTDESHNGFLAYSGGWSNTMVTRNFGIPMTSEFTVSFDVNPLAFNNYLEGEVPDGVRDKIYNCLQSELHRTADEMSQNLQIHVGSTFAEENPDSGVGGSPKVMELFGNRLGFNKGVDGDYVEVENGKWYNVSLTFNPEVNKVSGVITPEGGEPNDIGTTTLPSNLTNGTASRLAFYIPYHVYVGLQENGGTTGQLSYEENGETKTYNHSNSSKFAIDNFKVTYKAPELKINQIRLYDVFGEDFGPLQETNSMVKTAKIYFSEDIAEEYINDSNILVTDGAGKSYGFELISYDAESYVAEIKFDDFLRRGQSYTVSAIDIASSDGKSVVKEYNTTFSMTSDTVFKYEFDKTIDSMGEEVTGKLSGSNTLYAEGYAVNTTDDDEELDISVAAYKDSETGTQMLKLNEALIDASAPSYTQVDNATNPISIYVDSIDYYAKTFVVNPSDYTSAANATAKQSADYKLYAEIDAKAGNKLYIKVSDTKGNVVYKDVKVPENDGTFGFNIIVPDTTLTDSYTATVYNDADMTVSEVRFAYSNPTDKQIAVTDINRAEGDAETVKGIIKAKYLALGISQDIFDNMSVSKVVELLGNTSLTIDNVSKVLNNLAAITIVDGGKTENLFDYTDALRLDESDIKGLYTKGYVTEAVEKEITEALKGSNFESLDKFYDSLNEQFVLSVVKNADGYGNAKEVIERFKDEIVGNKNLSDKTYIYIANKSFDSFEKLGDALIKYENSISSNNKPSGGGGGTSPNLPNTIQVENSENTSGDAYTGNKEINVSIFDDIEDVTWAKSAIIYLAEQGIISGKSDKVFAPNDNVNREELAKILVGAFLEDAIDGEINFDDVDLSAWYAPYIKKAYGAGIVNGYNEATFGIGDNVTREDMAVMIYNAAKWAGMAFETKEFETFSDDNEISDYAKEAVYTLRNEGVINGVDRSTFAPKEPATRAQAAKIIYSLLMF